MADHESKKPGSDETVPSFLLTTLLVGLPFAGVLAAFHRAEGPHGHLATMQLVLLVEGLTMSFLRASNSIVHTAECVFRGPFK